MLLLDLYAALRPIDAITGATTDILNRIFSALHLLHRKVIRFSNPDHYSSRATRAQRAQRGRRGCLPTKEVPCPEPVIFLGAGATKACGGPMTDEILPSI